MSARLKFKAQISKLSTASFRVKFLFFLVACALLLVPPTYALAPLSSSNFNYLVNGQTTIEGSIFHSFICMIAGVSPLNPCSGYQVSNGTSQPQLKGESGSFSFAKPVVMDQLAMGGGALSAGGSLMASLYQNPPTSTTEYMANLGQSFGIIQPAYAQVSGSGEAIIRPVFNLWQVTRNLTYLAFILVIIAIGFMIMFRQKINPQTIVTVQQSLPNIVIGLALVTFSYLIASLVIDLTFLGSQLVTQVFIQTGGNSFGGPKELNSIARDGSFFNLFGATINGNNLGHVFGGTFNQFSKSFGWEGSAIPLVLGAVGGFLAFGIPGAIIGGTGGAAAPVLIPVLIIVILLFALFIQMIRVVFALISAYIELLVLTVVGPFLILMGSIPGRGGSINFWFRGLLANALIFPAVLGAFFFIGVILGPTSTAGASLFTVYAQDNKDPTLPLFGGLSAEFIKVLIAYGILLGLPAVPNMVKEAFKYKGPQGIANEAIGGVNAGILGMRSTMAFGGGLNAQAYERGLWERPLTALRNNPRIPMGVRSRIAPYPRGGAITNTPPPIPET